MLDLPSKILSIPMGVEEGLATVSVCPFPRNIQDPYRCLRKEFGGLISIEGSFLESRFVLFGGGSTKTG